MKILCLIDSLGSGGAQRQMAILSCGLKAKGYDVELFIYHPHFDFFTQDLVRAGITINKCEGVSGFSFKVAWQISKLIREKCFDAVISFLPSPNVYSILAKIISRSRVRLLVCERASMASDSGFWYFLGLRILYLVAARVVVNSHHHASYLASYFWLRNKLVTVYNGYPIQNATPSYYLRSYQFLRFLVVGRVDCGKNGVRLLKALALFYKRNGYVPQVSWVGRQEQDKLSLQVRAEMDQLIEQHPALNARWNWLGERFDVKQLISESDALIHVSLFEGLPNVICEAFIEGRPVIASAVCDHPLLVGDGTRGLLCDPLSPESICATIENFKKMTIEERQSMGRNARKYAEGHLTEERMVVQYEALLK